MVLRGNRKDSGCRPRSSSASAPVRYGLLGVALIALLVAGTSASTAGAVVRAPAKTVVSTMVHDPIQIEHSSQGLVTSTNWSGYADTGAVFNDVVGTWVQPTATCPKNQQQDASFWVGIDGFQKNSGTVEQIGTDSDCNKGSKKKPSGPTYYAWWEMFPQPSMNLSKAQYPVSPGNRMSAEVFSSGLSSTGETFTLTLRNLDQGWMFQTQQTANVTQTSAEWIAEAPSICKKSKCTPVKLADFTTVNFTGGAANGNPIDFAAYNENRINMKKGSTLKASTSALAGGSAFSVDWHHL